MLILKKLLLKNKFKNLIFDTIISHELKTELQEKERIQIFAKRVKETIGYAPDVIDGRLFIGDLEVFNIGPNWFSLKASNSAEEHTICSREDLVKKFTLKKIIGANYKGIYD